ncbi:hypothetical protein [Corynebacterium halotolerans]|uniref:Uncharacterized protein n=1 Tax=Corynebacterium halotolerans YIM 70093 = DSM 44683 TaxID=1121362 RepID=M1NUZ7_9CORY|nr:hypothetical protein [Corynebacterium halotolerans]AGF71330.1 hypothetical protein A605_01580 [Corynebacterium halotolerans YIM 70093 = DSM 44683]
MSVLHLSKRHRRASVAAAALALTTALLPTFGATQAQAQETTDQKTIQQQLAAPETVCGPYGLDNDDPRTNPGGLEGEGVSLGIPHVSEAGTEGTYHLFTRDVDFSRPVGVVVRLHGDGAYEYYYPGRSMNCQAAVAASHNMVLVAPHSPSVSEYGEPIWWYEIPKNVEWVSDLLYTDILPMENVDPDNIWWVGYSGGAEFITYGLIPLAPELVTGGAVMLGGGGAPDQTYEARDAERAAQAREASAFAPARDAVDAAAAQATTAAEAAGMPAATQAVADVAAQATDAIDAVEATVFPAAGAAVETNPAEEALNSVPMHWAVGTEDDGTDEYAPFNALEAAQEGAEFFRERGIENVTLTQLEGNDHFDLPQAAILDAALTGTVDDDSTADPAPEPEPAPVQ